MNLSKDSVIVSTRYWFIKMHIIILGIAHYLRIYGEYDASVIGPVFILSTLLFIILASSSTSCPQI